MQEKFYRKPDGSIMLRTMPSTVTHAIDIKLPEKKIEYLVNNEMDAEKLMVLFKTLPRSEQLALAVRIAKELENKLIQWGKNMEKQHEQN